jgi:hypothetical protein
MRNRRSIRSGSSHHAPTSDSSEGREAIRALVPTVTWVALENKDLLHPGPSLARALGPLCASLR